MPACKLHYNRVHTAPLTVYPTHSGFKFSQLEMSGYQIPLCVFSFIHAFLPRGCPVPPPVEVHLRAVRQEGQVDLVRCSLPDSWRQPKAIYAVESRTIQGSDSRVTLRMCSISRATISYQPVAQSLYLVMSLSSPSERFECARQSVAAPPSGIEPS